VRLGLLGGTFDPPHYGHLVAAQEVAWKLELDRVLFLPARQNPLKQGEAVTDAELRCELVRAAIGSDQRFELSRLDLDRPPPSYTVDLLRQLHGHDRQLFFVIGADILPELPRWHALDEIIGLATLVVVTRPGAPPHATSLERRLHLVRIPGVDVSSTELRRRVRAGEPIAYLTPPAVERVIRERHLYRD
jgi:nicotinate-nucleotide adenylyltransferase